MWNIFVKRKVIYKWAVYSYQAVFIVLHNLTICGPAFLGLLIGPNKKPRVLEFIPTTHNTANIKGTDYKILATNSSWQINISSDKLPATNVTIDTIDTTNGFIFDTYMASGLIATINEAVALYKHKKQWQEKVKKAMTYNFSWQDSAKKYIQLYQTIRSGRNK